MSKRLRIERHLTSEELEQRYRAARDGVERSQWPIIWLLAGGATSQEVAAVTGYSLPWMQAIATRYTIQGAEGISDGRHRNPGQAPLLTAEQQQELVRVLEGPGPEGAAGAGRGCVARILKERTRHELPPLVQLKRPPRTGWR